MFHSTINFWSQQIKFPIKQFHNLGTQNNLCALWTRTIYIVKKILKLAVPLEPYSTKYTYRPKQ